jgi:hypothetical protein
MTSASSSEPCQVFPANMTGRVGSLVGGAGLLIANAPTTPTATIKRTIALVLIIFLNLSDAAACV